MVITKPNELLVKAFSQRFYAIELQKFSKTSKKIKISLKITKALSRRHKKHVRLLENVVFVHKASFYCKSGLSLTRYQYEK